MGNLVLHAGKVKAAGLGAKQKILTISSLPALLSSTKAAVQTC